MTRIVLDTNVLVSGMINPHGAPGRIIDQIREGRVELVVDDRILAEYTEVLHRPKFKRYFQANDVSDILMFLNQNVHYVVSTTHISDMPDADDVPFLEVAITAAVPLVTGNIVHFPEHYCEKIGMYVPADFLAQL